MKLHQKLDWWFRTKNADMYFRFWKHPFLQFTCRVQDNTKESFYFSMDPTSLDPSFTMKFAVPPKDRPWYKRIHWYD